MNAIRESNPTNIYNACGYAILKMDFYLSQTLNKKAQESEQSFYFSNQFFLDNKTIFVVIVCFVSFCFLLFFQFIDYHSKIAAKIILYFHHVDTKSMNKQINVIQFQLQYYFFFFPYYCFYITQYLFVYFRITKKVSIQINGTTTKIEKRRLI